VSWSFEILKTKGEYNLLKIGHLVIELKHSFQISNGVPVLYVGSNRILVLPYPLEIYRCFPLRFRNLVTKNTLKIKINHNNLVKLKQFKSSVSLLRMAKFEPLTLFPWRRRGLEGHGRGRESSGEDWKWGPPSTGTAGMEEQV
jgi:hypothetical protein